MKDFNFYAPTEVVFGRDSEEQVAKLIKRYGGHKVLVHYGGKSAEKSGLLDVDEEGHTTRAGVFAAGDAAHGARTVVEAVVTGKRVAEAMHAYMQSLPLPEPSPYANVPTHTEQAAAAQAEQVFY